MLEMDRFKSNPDNSCSIKYNKEASGEVGSNSISLLGKFDRQTIIQAVVMSELLGKPKAKRRKRGRF